MLLMRTVLNTISACMISMAMTAGMIMRFAEIAGFFLLFVFSISSLHSGVQRAGVASVFSSKISLFNDDIIFCGTVQVFPRKNVK